MAAPNLFSGIAVLIDDEIQDNTSNIRAIQAQIEEKGCHVVGMNSLPDATKLANLSTASFFVVDWNLHGRALTDEFGTPAAPAPAGLTEQHISEMIQFLKELKKVRFAPVFIFTNESVEAILDELREHHDLYDENDPSHISVVSKDDILARGVFNVLTAWLQQAPSAYVLKRWELEYEKAKNALFLDFYAKSVHWPVILKKTFEDDEVPPSAELGNLIGRNLLSRMTPFEFDLEAFDDAPLKSLEADQVNYRKTLMKVLEGERFLPKDQLHMTSISAGDVFKEGEHYFVNIRPDCDCVARQGKQPDEIELYLLRGDKLTTPKVAKLYSTIYGTLKETEAETIVFAMTNGISVSFRLKELSTGTWGEWKEKRIGRLLPPFLTRLQQRYAAYLQRPGITRVPEAAVDLSSITSEHLEVQPAETIAGTPISWIRRLLLQIADLFDRPR